MRKLICVSAFLLALAEFSVAQNSTLKCETFPGADAGAKMAACIAAMPNGGTADAKALTGSQTITTDVFAGVSKSGTLLLADATYTLTGSSACFNVPSHWTVHGIGEDKSIFQGKGQCQGAIGRTVLTKGSFVTLEYFKVEGTNIAEQCVGLLDGHDDTVRYVWADHCGQYGIVASNRQPPTASTPFTNTRIEHNKVTNYGNSEGFGSIGIEVFPKSADAFEKNERGEWVQIPATSKRLAQEMLAPGIVIASNESIAQPGMIVTGCGLKLNGAQDGLIQNNTVDLSGIRLDKGNQGGICALTSEHVEIVDNRITGGINSISLSGGMDPATRTGARTWSSGITKLSIPSKTVSIALTARMDWLSMEIPS